MSVNINVTQGKSLVLLIRNDGDTEWEVAGGVKSRGSTVDNPVEDTTSSSTTSTFAESQFTGFATSTLNLSGVADTRTGQVDPVSGFNVVGYKRLEEIALRGQPCAKFKLLDVSDGTGIEGFYNLTNFSKTGETPGIITWEGTLQSAADVTVTT